MRVVMIDWLDSGQPISEWQFLDGFKFQRAHRCVTVGHYLGESEDAVTVAISTATVDHTDEMGQASGITLIPKCAIVLMRDLKPV